MTEITIQVADDLKQFLDAQVEGGGYGSAGEYIRRLLVRARQGKQHLESLLIEGLDSGETIPLDGAEWNQIHSEVHDRLAE